MILFSFNDPSFDLTPSELSRQHQPRGPLQAVEDYLQSKIGMYQWANTATPLTNEAQTFASPLLISDCMLVGILRRAGAALENPSIFPTLRKVIASFLTQTLQTLPLHEHTETGRPPVWITNDVMHNCLRNAHLDVYGHGGVAGVRFVLCTGIKRVLASVHPGVLLSGPSLSVMHDMIVDCIDRLVRAGLQHSYCVSSTGLVVHVPAGPMNTTSGHYNTDETVDLVLEAHQVPHGAVASTVPTRTLNSHAIQTAILQCMSPQLAKFAVSEGNNCIMKLSHHGYADLISTTATSLDSRCGLEFSVPYVAMITKKVHDVTLTVEGAAFLTAACQFLCAEILVLSGNYAVDSGITMLDARSIMLAVHNDEELKKFFPNPIAGAGGVSMMHGAVVQIQNALPVDDVEGEENEDEERYLMGLSKTSFEYMLLKKMKGAGGVMVDPRTGRHCTIAPMVGMVSVPEFDAACGSDAQTRAAVASALLSPAERAVMDHSRQTLKHSFVGRILQIRKMQGDDCTSCLDAAKFAIGVYDLLGTKLFPSISNRLCCLLTADALIHLRDATEAYMLSLLSDAVLAMCTNGRKIFEDKDLILTLRMKNIQL